MYVILLPVWSYFVVFQNSLGSEPCVLYEISEPLNDEFHSTYVMHKIINRQAQGRLNEQEHAECIASFQSYRSPLIIILYKTALSIYLLIDSCMRLHCFLGICAFLHSLCKILLLQWLLLQNIYY